MLIWVICAGYSVRTLVGDRQKLARSWKKWDGFA